ATPGDIIDSIQVQTSEAPPSGESRARHRRQDGRRLRAQVELEVEGALVVVLRSALEVEQRRRSIRRIQRKRIAAARSCFRLRASSVPRVDLELDSKAA